MNAFPLISAADRHGYPAFPLKRVSVARILETVADFYGVSLPDLCSSRRGAEISRPRQMAMYLAWELTTFSYANIGRHIGDRDHSTICHGIWKVRQRLKDDPAANHAADTLLQRLTA